MPKPLAICLEDLEARSPAMRYLRCVAVVGRRPGLRVDGEGRALWQTDEGAAVELWVSADDRLILYRRSEAGRVTVRRVGRTLEAPAAKPVVLCDQDEIEVGSKRLRVHVHGPTPAASEPSYLPVRAASGAARAAAAAVALGAALGAGAACRKDEPRTTPPDGPGDPGIEVREFPPEMPNPPDLPPEPSNPSLEDAATPSAQEDVIVLDAGGQEIEVREYPPEMAAEPLEGGKGADAGAAAAPEGSDAGAADVKDTATEPRRPRDAGAIEVREFPPDMPAE